MTTHNKSIILHCTTGVSPCAVLATVDGTIVHHGLVIDSITFTVPWTFYGYKKITITVLLGELKLGHTSTCVIRPGRANIVSCPLKGPGDPKSHTYINGVLSTPTQQQRNQYNAHGEWCYTLSQGSTMEFNLKIEC